MKSAGRILWSTRSSAWTSASTSSAEHKSRSAKCSGRHRIIPSSKTEGVTRPSTFRSRQSHPQKTALIAVRRQARGLYISRPPDISSPAQIQQQRSLIPTLTSSRKEEISGYLTLIQHSQSRDDLPSFRLSILELSSSGKETTHCNSTPTSQQDPLGMAKLFSPRSGSLSLKPQSKFGWITITQRLSGGQAITRFALVIYRHMDVLPPHLVKRTSHSVSALSILRRNWPTAICIAGRDTCLPDANQSMPVIWTFQRPVFSSSPQPQFVRS